MSSHVTWTPVIDALLDKTESQTLVWRNAGDSGGAYFAAASILQNMYPRTFTATVGKTDFELSAGDSYGNGPYELKVWETRAGKRVSVAALNSRIHSVLGTGIGSSLENLYRAVDRSVERDADVVARLLNEIEDL